MLNQNGTQKQVHKQKNVQTLFQLYALFSEPKKKKKHIPSQFSSSL